MRIWVRLEDIPLVKFLVPKATPNEEQLVGFHLSRPMGYVEYAAFFCTTTNTVKEPALDTLSMCYTTPLHHLEDLADTKLPQTSAEKFAATLEADNNWEALSPHTRVTALAHFEVYLNHFIGITQGELYQTMWLCKCVM